MCCNSSATTSTRRCTTLIVLPWYVSIWTVVQTWSTCSASARPQALSGNRMNLKKWSSALFQRSVTFSLSVSVIVILNRPIYSCSHRPLRWKSSTLVSRRITIRKRTMVESVRWPRSEEHLSIWVQLSGSRTLKMEVTRVTPPIASTSPTFFHAVWYSTSALRWRMLRASIRGMMSMTVSASSMQVSTSSNKGTPTTSLKLLGSCSSSRRRSGLVSSSWPNSCSHQPRTL